MKPIYNYLNDLPGLHDLPALPAHIVKRTVGHHTSFDAGRDRILASMSRDDRHC